MIAVALMAFLACPHINQKSLNDTMTVDFSTKHNKQWVKSCDGEILNVSGILFVSKVVDGNQLVGMVGGEHYVVPAINPDLLLSFIGELFDNDIVYTDLYIQKSDEDSDDEYDTSTGQFNKGEDDLLPVRYNPKFVYAVYHQCDGFEEKDMPYCFVLSNGQKRNIFCSLPLTAILSKLGTKDFTIPAPASYCSNILDDDDPCYVVTFRRDTVTSYYATRMVAENGGFVEVALTCGHHVNNLWITSYGINNTGMNVWRDVMGIGIVEEDDDCVSPPRKRVKTECSICL